MLKLQLSPAKSSKIPYSIQLLLASFWFFTGLYVIFIGKNGGERDLIQMSGMIVSFIFIAYLLLQNTSIIGSQSYIEFTPGYIVEKNGVFKVKNIIEVTEIEQVNITLKTLRITCTDGATHNINLKQLKSKNVKRLKEELTKLAKENNFQFTQV